MMIIVMFHGKKVFSYLRSREAHATAPTQTKLTDHAGDFDGNSWGANNHNDSLPFAGDNADVMMMMLLPRMMMMRMMMPPL